jgi:hypothetical protein
VVDSPASNIEGYHKRDIHVSSLLLNRPILNEVNGSPMKTLRGRHDAYQKLNPL